MKTILNGKSMKEADAYTIEKMGVPSLVLMERASLKAVEAMEAEGICLKQMLVVCGSGNNGGDGFAVARMLLLKGSGVTAVLAGKEEHCTQETKTQMRIYENYGGKIFKEIPEKAYTAVVDALFGIGLSREVRGQYAQVIERMNGFDADKVAIDIPSGIDSSTGEVLGTAFRADLTVTFAYPKAGMLFYPGAFYAGHVRTEDIGIYKKEHEKGQSFWCYEESDIKKVCPKRKADANKGTYGKVLMLTGSRGMSGAAYLSAKAAYRMGAGLVQICTSEANRIILQSRLPEAIVSAYGEGEAFSGDALREKIGWADVICLGCGLGVSDTSGRIVRTVMDELAKEKKPCVVDADGLNLFSAIEETEQKGYLRAAGDCMVFTPHIKEFSRLLGKDMEETKKNRISLAQQYAETYNIILTAKDARTVVAGKGKTMYLNLSGDASLAKAGSGDVLAGMTAGFLALGMERFEAAAFGAYIHGLAGEAAGREKGMHGAMAEELTEKAAVILGGTE